MYTLLMCFPIHQVICVGEMQLCITFRGGMYCICANRYDMIARDVAEIRNRACYYRMQIGFGMHYYFPDKPVML